MRSACVRLGTLLAVLFATSALRLWADEPKPKAENTLSISVEPVKPQTFPRPVKFFLDKVIDRSGNPQPMMMFRPRGGVFIDREPVAVVREALENSLKSADLLAADKESADYVLDVYIFHFGLGESSGLELFGKVDLNVLVKDRSGHSETVTAMGTSIQGTAIRKKNIMKNMEADLEGALADALRNFLRGSKLRTLVMASAEAATRSDAAQPGAPPASDKPQTAGNPPPPK